MLCSGDRWDDFVTNKNSILNTRGAAAEAKNQERIQEQQQHLDSCFSSESFPESIKHSDNTPKMHKLPQQQQT